MGHDGIRMVSFFLLLCLIMSFLSMIKAMSDLERTLYMDVTSVNTSDCLHLVEQLPLR